MTISETLLPEYDQEMAATRAFLERIPAEHASWRPHPKSMPLGSLAVHVAALPAWVASTMAGTGLELSTLPPPPPFTTVGALLADFDANVAAGRAALSGAADADFAVPWSLRAGARVYFTAPRAAVLRSFVLSHLIHHRAQLGVCLRLRDVPLPPCYGPTADVSM